MFSSTTAIHFTRPFVTVKLQPVKPSLFCLKLCQLNKKMQSNAGWRLPNNLLRGFYMVQELKIYTALNSPNFLKVLHQFGWF